MRRRLLAPAAAVLAAAAAWPGTAAAAPRPMRAGVWTTPAELRALPERGPAWTALKRVADEPIGTPHLNGKNSSADTHTLAAALVYARTADPGYATKVRTALMAVIGSERGGRTLALARGLQAYVIAADLVDLHRLDPAADQAFRTWLAAVRTERLRPADTPTLIATHEIRPNNWGTHAGASRMAADVYLGDTTDLARAAKVFKGWLGDRAAYHGFKYGPRSWQADPTRPVAINPPGAVLHGHPVDGALPDDLRRGCGFQFPPCPTGYPWEAMQGAVVQAEILHRQGYDAYDWGHQALLRATRFLLALDRRYPTGGWGISGDDTWIPWLLNARYHTHLPTTSPTQPGKGIGFTDWTLGPTGRRVTGSTAGTPTPTTTPPPSGSPASDPGRSSSPSATLPGELGIGALVLAAALTAVLARRRGQRHARP
ncbi:hypothetical protein FSW04_21365 [Baekduia soli]|uniref:Alginate lyase domain-containing protein n=1 Tax=Baekduia soli TaxID=496014 RepID=A0A5B8UA63_9ACTN|nr:alginate lyase family protein [Baekduia soli]QEC49864.1 hypothetical protein FSW04_21365 [Baekduia soli]